MKKPDKTKVDKDIFAEIAKVAAEAAKAAEAEVTAARPAPQDHVDQELLKRQAVRLAKAGYDMTPHMVEILESYIKGYNIWLVGKPGVGKTFFFKCLNKVRRDRGVYKIVILSMIETQGWTMEDAKTWIEVNADNDVMIDDVGSEPVMVSFGMKAELFPYLLEARMTCGRRTHITSNVDKADILDRYGVRVADRFAQFFKRCKMDTTGSRRTLKPWISAEQGGV
jgi:hypothetical protein